MTTERLLCSVCSLFSALCLYATITGVVVDEENTPLPGATVILTDSTYTPYRFGSSEENGAFDLGATDYSRNDWLLIKCIGFKGDTLSLKRFSSGQTIRLRPSSYVLKGVDVTASAKGYQHGDTINYLVNSFLDASDKSISDVIRKMPGLDVNKDGSIEFNGKRINSIYVEGLDMMGSKYSQVSENLKASNVKKVQVLLDHQPIKILSDKEYSDKVSLNLTLTEDAKDVWQWNGKVAAGYEDDGTFLRSLDVSALTFSRKKQSLSFYKGNNTGENITNETSSDEWFDNSFDSNRPIINTTNFSVPYLDEENYVRNDSHTFSSNWLVPTSGHGELRLQIGGMIDHEKFNQAQETVYLNLAQPDSAIETKTLTFDTQMLNSKVSYLLNHPQVYFKNEVGILCELGKSAGETNVNESRLSEQTEPDKFIVRDDISFMKKFGKNIFAVNGNILYRKYPTSLMVLNGQSQQTKQEYLSFSAATSLTHTIAGFNIKYNIGIAADKHKFSLDRNDCTAVNDYYDVSTYFEPILNYGNENIKMEFSCPIDFNYQKFSSSTHYDNNSNIRALPRLQLTYRPTSLIRLGGSYRLGWKSMAFGDLIDILYFTNSSSGRQGNGEINDSRYHNISAFFQYSNMLTGWNASLNANYSIADGQPIYTGIFADDIYVSRVSDSHSSMYNTYLNSRISKSFDFWDISIALIGRFNNMRSKILMGDILSPQNLTNQSLAFRFYLKPIRQIVISSESSFSFTKQKIENANMVMKNSHTSFSQELNMALLFGKWECELKNKYFKDGNNTYDSLLFSDLSISYQRGKCTFGVNINNIWNNEFYKRQIITETRMEQTLTHLRQREILAQFTFDL